MVETSGHHSTWSLLDCSPAHAKCCPCAHVCCCSCVAGQCLFNGSMGCRTCHHHCGFDTCYSSRSATRGSNRKRVLWCTRVSGERVTRDAHTWGEYYHRHSVSKRRPAQRLNQDDCMFFVQRVRSRGLRCTAFAQH